MPRYLVPVTSTYLDTVTVEAESPAEAMRLILDGELMSDLEDWTNDPEPLLSIVESEITELPSQST